MSEMGNKSVGRDFNVGLAALLNKMAADLLCATTTFNTIVRRVRKVRHSRCYR